MPMHEEPVVGASYKDLEEGGRTFEVLAFDENIGTVEIQFSDGTTKEIDLDDWYGMDLEQQESDEDDTDDVDDTDATDDDSDPDDDDEEEEE